MAFARNVSLQCYDIFCKFGTYILWQYFNDVREQISHLVIPLTPRYISRWFGPRAVQLCSGDSFVIQSDDRIYKLPFFASESLKTMMIIVRSWPLKISH